MDCTSCGRELDPEEDVDFDGLCSDCSKMEEPTLEPEALDFRDHSHELEQQDEEELE